jgi:hypothetical protein
MVGFDEIESLGFACRTTQFGVGGWCKPNSGSAAEEQGAMEETTDDKWISRQELADRYGVPVKTPAEWASRGTGQPYAKFGCHVRYRLRDVVAWEAKQLDEHNRDSA